MKDKKVLIVLAVAFLIRLLALNQSLWLDEATTARVVLHYNYFDIITKFSPFDFHPPLYYLLMKLWTGIFGYSEIFLRLPSVIFSLLTGWMIYKIGAMVENKKLGIWSMIFFLFNPLIMYYSQEARMYMMSTFLLSCAIYYFIKMLKVKSQRSKVQSNDFLLFNLFCILSFYTFYGSVFLIATFLLYFLYKKQYGIFMKSLIFNLPSFLIISPLLYTQFMHSRQALIYVTHWNLVLGKATIKNLLLIPLKFTSGRISFFPKLIFYAVTGG